MTVTISTVAQKGGVGKTTTSIALAIQAANQGLKTIFIDFDSQSSGSSSLASKDQLKSYTDSYSFLSLTDFSQLKLYQVSENLHLLPSNLDLIQLENEDFDSYYSLKEQCAKMLSDFDLIIIDTPGTLKTTVVAALTASNYFYSPLELSAYSLKAFNDVETTVKKVKERLNPSLSFLGFVLNRVHGFRLIDDKLVPNQLSERDDYEKFFSKSGQVLSMISERSDIRTTTQQGLLIDENNESTKELFAFCKAILDKTGLTNE